MPSYLTQTQIRPIELVMLPDSTVPVTIREYSDLDWVAVCTIHDLARPDELLGSCDPRAFVPLADDLEDAANFHRSHKFVACVGSQVVGFVGVDGTYLSWLYVAPAFYRRGIGRQLLRWGIQCIGPQAWTIALAGNSRARKLYESEGFRVIRTYEGQNAGYRCMCLKLALSSSTGAAAGDGGDEMEEISMPTGRD